MQNPKKLIESSLKNILNEMSGQDVQPEISLVSDSQFGDFTTNIAMVVVKQTEFSNPRDLAASIVSKLQEDSEVSQVFEKIEVAGPGFINFFLSSKYLLNTLEFTVQNEDQIGVKDIKSDQKVIVEYSSPNIAKPFTIGHLRSTIIGDAVANLLETQGYQVLRDNHLGDWGSQFGKQIYAIKKWGDMEEIEKSENPVKDLVALYVKFHEEAEKDASLEDEARAWFKKLEDGDDEARALWKKCIDWSMKEFERIYKILGVTFTENNRQGYGESFFEDKMDVVIQELRDKKLLKESNGAELVFFPDDKYPPLMILKKDGTTLYATRDLATDKFRFEKYGQDVVIINEVGIEQELYFRQLFELEKMLGWVREDQRIHIKHGHYRFAEGKMSTRKGNVIWLDDVLKEAEKRANDLSKQVKVLDEKSSELGLETPDAQLSDGISNALIIAIGAIKWNDLKRDSKQDIAFDWDDILNMQGNSGPYLQYTYVRTRSVLEKVKSQNSKGKSESLNIKIVDLEKEESELLRYLAQYEYILSQAAGNYAPSALCNYLFELSQKFNLFYQKCKIIGSGKEGLRLNLTQAVGVILKHGLTTLGIQTVDQM